LRGLRPAHTPRIAGPAQKAGQNPWVQAITDADQSVQTFLEITTLAHFPDASFFGEEQDTSRNTFRRLRQQSLAGSDRQDIPVPESAQRLADHPVNYP
jgi:hypothetical protein